MSGPVRPHLLIATQAVDGNPAALRLIRLSAEFGTVSVITPQAGPDNSSGLVFERLVPPRERLIRTLLAAVRRLGLLLPRRWQNALLPGWLDRRLGFVHQGRNFRRLWRARRLRPALLILDGAEFMTVAGDLARAAGSGLVYYVHEMVPNENEFYTRCLTAWLCALERRECRAASHIIVQHELWARLLRRRYRLPAGKFTEVTPSPPPCEPLPGSSPGQPLRLYYHGLYAGNRGLRGVINAVAMTPETTLDLRGSGPYEAELRECAAAGAAADRIRFLPPLPTADLAESGRTYDLGIVPGSRAHLNGRMAAGGKLYEYLASGIGILGFRAVTLRNCVRRHGAGFFCTDPDPETVAALLRRCVADRAAVTEARRCAVKATREIYNADFQDAKLRRVLAEALAAAGQARPPIPV